ncbi:uncharacterized protein RCC_12079 [Ramularia collo-cygni]|uniref:Uncharacterized protein n=1 Tax=Ramularia collo-cygni TaxID=112498 RepID=A0A2D3V4K8_9PEZI|nr:uncharacterized protein RCC_12079 [Ramularia collo-cygni]CZT15223.1 uncharacterized protein RCC_12079 [Ramularia collo-cygni]
MDNSEEYDLGEFGEELDAMIEEIVAPLLERMEAYMQRVEDRTREMKESNRTALNEYEMAKDNVEEARQYWVRKYQQEKDATKARDTSMAEKPAPDSGPVVQDNGVGDEEVESREESRERGVTVTARSAHFPSQTGRGRGLGRGIDGLAFGRRSPTESHRSRLGHGPPTEEDDTHVSTPRVRGSGAGGLAFNHQSPPEQRRSPCYNAGLAEDGQSDGKEDESQGGDMDAEAVEAAGAEATEEEIPALRQSSRQRTTGV